MRLAQTGNKFHFLPPELTFLLASQKSDSRRERPPVKIAESEELRRVDVVIHRKGVLPVGNVVKTSTQRPVKSGCMETFLQVEVQREVRRKTVASGRFNDLLLIIDRAEKPTPD